MMRNRTLAAWAIGVAGYALGLVLSTALDLPTVHVIVWMLASLAVMPDACLAMRRHPRTSAA